MSEETLGEQGNTENASVDEQPVNTAEKQDGEQGANTEPEKATEQSAIEYADFTFPEGEALDQEVLDDFKLSAKEFGLSQENAQKLVDIGLKLSAKVRESATENWKAQVAGWAEQSKADKEFGGKDFEANLGVARSAIDQFGTQAFKDILDQSGLGNHPEVLRFAHRIGKAIGNDTVLSGVAPPQNKHMYSYMNEDK